MVINSPPPEATRYLREVIHDVFAKNRLGTPPESASSFRAVDGNHRTVTPLATLPSISKLYFTHSQHASGQSLVTGSIFALASL
jgi:hypothetical protein